MKSKEERKPNPLLREQRLLRGWSLQRVVDALCALSAASDERLPGANTPMVSNWETGTKKPSPFYRERLCKLYNMTADQLGFMDAPALPHHRQPFGVAQVSASRNGYYHVPPIQSALPLAIPKPKPSISVIPREQIKAIDLLSDGAEHTPDEQLSAWLTLGANHLSMLLDAGWSSEQVLDSLRVVLQGVQGLSSVSRRKLLELGATALINGIPLLPGGQVAESERIRATEALGKSIGDGWKLFHTTSTELLFTIAEAQLFMMQQIHALLFSSVRCAFYQIAA